MYIINAGCNRSLHSSCSFSTLQPLFRIRKKISICQRQRYHCSFSRTWSPVVTGRLVSNIQVIGFSPLGGRTSSAKMTVTSTDGKWAFFDGGRKLTRTALRRWVTGLRCLECVEGNSNVGQFKCRFAQYSRSGQLFAQSTVIGHGHGHGPIMFGTN